MRPGECPVDTMTTIDNARRAFFTGSAVALDHHVPWAVMDFEGRCRRCGDCLVACEEVILTLGDGGFPTVDFERGACTFCAACVTACKYEALDLAVEPVWRLKVEIGPECLSQRGITCRSCGDACEVAAIRFRLAVGGRAVPTLDSSVCSGCGACVAVCPEKAIGIGKTHE